jgi:hypothetical protein
MNHTLVKYESYLSIKPRFSRDSLARNANFKSSNSKLLEVITVKICNLLTNYTEKNRNLRKIRRTYDNKILIF